VKDATGKAYFKRSFQFNAPSAQPPCYFRAACGKKITAITERTFSVDQLEVRLTSDHKGILREGDPSEVLIPLSLPQGRSQLTLDYQW
jgi:hypothetical protein